MNVSAEESLWLAFPVLLVIIGLTVGIVYLQNQSVDVRSRASQPTPTVTPRALPSGATPQAPEVVCTATYEPVCSVDKTTYSNSCEAELAGVYNYTPGPCQLNQPYKLPQIRE